MDTNQQNSGDIQTDIPASSDFPDQPETNELSHSDKMTGVITEPSATFESMAKFPPRTIDWLLPVLLLLFIAAAANLVKMTNPEVAYQAKEAAREQFSQMEKDLQNRVDKGEITQEQADQQMEMVQGWMDSPMGKVISSASIVLGGFVFFILIGLFYFLIARFVFKDNGLFTSALAATGLVSYIGIIQIILSTVLALALSKFIVDTSAANFFTVERTSIQYYILSKIDPISIWSYVVLSIGLAKMFNSTSTLKYYLLVFLSWLIGGLIFWAIGFGM